MSKQKITLAFVLSVLSAISIQAQTSMTDLNNRQISETSNAIDRTLTRKKKNAPSRKAAVTAKGKKLNSRNNQQVSVPKAKTYFSYIGVKVDNLSSDTENLSVSLTFTNIKTGEIIRRKYSYDRSQDGFGVNDVPPGKYKLTADAVYKGKSVKALVGSNNVWTRTETVPYSALMEVELITFVEDGIECIKSEPGDLKVKIIE